MGNYCHECNNNNIDEGHLSEKIEINPSNKKQSKISNCETKTNHNIEILQTHSDNNSQNYIEQGIQVEKNNKSEQIIPENIINNTRKLKLIILQSKYIKEGNVYIINAGGLIGSKRNAKDGFTYFGDISVSSIFNYNVQENHTNDFEFPEEESKNGQSNAEIRYDITLDQYQIRSLRGSGCFIKIDEKIVRLINN